MKPEQKKYLIVVAVIFFLLIIGYWLFGGKKQKQINKKEVFPTEMIIPTVDSSVEVDLMSSVNGKEVKLSIKNIPEGTKIIDYELSYNTAAQGLQGVLGTINLKIGELSYEKEITLGTCSAGKCVYHQVVGKIKLSLKFSGDYGEKVFEKEYEI